MFQLLLFAVLSIWLFTLCGKGSSKKKTMENEKKAAEAKKRAEEAKAKKEQELEAETEYLLQIANIVAKAKLLQEGKQQEEEKMKIARESTKGKDEKEIEKLVRAKSWDRENTDVGRINSCRYYRMFIECNIDFKMMEMYYNMRNLVEKILGTGKDVEVRKWLNVEMKLAKIYIPFFGRVVNEFYPEYHKDHATPEVLNKLKKVHQTIIDHHKKIEAAWKSTQEKGKEGDNKKMSELPKNEEWKKIAIFPGEKVESESWRERDLAMNVMDHLIPRKPTMMDSGSAVLETCKVEFGGECDFAHRINYCVSKERMFTSNLHDRPSAAGKGFMTVGEVCRWLREEVKDGEAYLSLIEEKLEIHMNHSKDPDSIEACYEKHAQTIEEIKEYLKEFEKIDASEELNKKRELERFPRTHVYWTFERGYNEYNE